MLTNLKLGVGEIARLPDGEECRVAVPVVVGFGNVASVV